MSFADSFDLLFSRYLLTILFLAFRKTVVSGVFSRPNLLVFIWSGTCILRQRPWHSLILENAQPFFSWSNYLAFLNSYPFCSYGDLLEAVSPMCLLMSLGHHQHFLCVSHNPSGLLSTTVLLSSCHFAHVLLESIKLTDFFFFYILMISYFQFLHGHWISLLLYFFGRSSLPQWDFPCVLRGCGLSDDTVSSPFFVCSYWYHVQSFWSVDILSSYHWVSL